MPATPLAAALARHVDAGDVPGLVAVVGRGSDLDVTVLGDQTIGGPPMRRGLAVPHRLDRQADHGGGDAGPRRRRRGGARRSRRRPPARAGVAARRAHADVAGRRHRGGEPGDHGRRSAALDQRPRLPVRLLGPGRACCWPSVCSRGRPSRSGSLPPDEWMAILGEIPLLHQPGEGFTYNAAFDILGVLVARASGRSFPTYLAERILRPLGMDETGFAFAAGTEARRTSYYGHGEGGDLELIDGPDGQWASEPRVPVRRRRPGLDGRRPRRLRPDAPRRRR